MQTIWCRRIVGEVEGACDSKLKSHLAMYCSVCVAVLQ